MHSQMLATLAHSSNYLEYAGVRTNTWLMSDPSLPVSVNELCFFVPQNTQSCDSMCDWFQVDKHHTGASTKCLSHLVAVSTLRKKKTKKNIPYI